MYNLKKLWKKYKHEAVLRPSDVAINSVDDAFVKKIIKVVEGNMGEYQFSLEKLGFAMEVSGSKLHRKAQGFIGGA